MVNAQNIKDGKVTSFALNYLSLLVKLAMWKLLYEQLDPCILQLSF